MSGAAKKVKSTTKGPFDVKDFCTKVSAFASANPSLSKRAYAKAAERIRAEAKGRPEEAALIALSANLDALAKSAPTPIVGMPEDYEEPYLGSEDPLVEERIEIGYEDHEHEVNMNAPMEDSLADAMEQHTNQMEVQKSIVQPVQVTPASAQSGVTLFGNSALVQFTNYVAPSGPAFVPFPGAMPEAQVVRWDGADQETMACTISLNRGSTGSGGGLLTSDPTAVVFLSGAGTYRPYAHVMWGTGQGGTNEAYLDVGRGTRFTIGATHIYVNVGMDPPPKGATSPSARPGAMRIGGSLAFFSTNSQSPVTRTVYVDNLAVGSGNANSYNVPVFATTLEAILGLTAGNSFSFVITDVNGNVIDVLSTTNPSVRSNSIVLDNEAYQILVTNNGAQAASCRMVFGLAL